MGDYNCLHELPEHSVLARPPFSPSPFILAVFRPPLNILWYRKCEDTWSPQAPGVPQAAAEKPFNFPAISPFLSFPLLTVFPVLTL